MIPEGWGPAGQQAGKVELEVGSWGAHVSKYKQKAKRLNREWSMALKSQSSSWWQPSSSKVTPPLSTHTKWSTVQTPEHGRAILIQPARKGNRSVKTAVVDSRHRATAKPQEGWGPPGSADPTYSVHSPSRLQVLRDQKETPLLGFLSFLMFRRVFAILYSKRDPVCHPLSYTHWTVFHLGKYFSFLLASSLHSPFFIFSSIFTLSALQNYFL